MPSFVRMLFAVCGLIAGLGFGCKNVALEPSPSICNHALTAGAASADWQSEFEVSEGRFFVALDSLSVADAEEVLLELGADQIRPVFTHGRNGRLLFAVTPVDSDALNNLQNDSRVRYVEPIGMMHVETDISPDVACDPVSDQFIPDGIMKLEAPDVWPRAQGEGVVAIILDSGIATGHVDFSPDRILGGVCVRADCVDANDFRDDLGHGTHVAGTLGADFDKVGVVGMAPQASFYIVKIFGGFGNASNEEVVAGIEAAAEYKISQPDVAMVANMSFGGSGSNAISDAIIGLADTGVIIVAAAGNNGDGNPATVDAMGMPGSLEDSIAIGAVGVDGIAPFSTNSPEVEFAAPGVGVISDMPGNQIVALNGTSMATPHVAGAVALLLSYNKILGKTCGSAGCIKGILKATAQDYGEPGRDIAFGFGEPRMIAAFDMLETLERH